jgi:hypothetical protein
MEGYPFGPAWDRPTQQTTPPQSARVTRRTYFLNFPAGQTELAALGVIAEIEPIKAIPESLRSGHRVPGSPRIHTSDENVRFMSSAFIHEGGYSFPAQAPEEVNARGEHGSTEQVGSIGFASGSASSPAQSASAQSKPNHEQKQLPNVS